MDNFSIERMKQNQGPKKSGQQAGKPDPAHPKEKRPSKGWRALIADRVAGAAAILKLAMGQQEKAEKTARVFEWLEANGLAIAKRNQDYEKKLGRKKNEAEACRKTITKIPSLHLSIRTKVYDLPLGPLCSGSLFNIRACTGQIVLVPEHAFEEAISRGGTVEP